MRIKQYVAIFIIKSKSLSHVTSCRPKWHTVDTAPSPHLPAISGSSQDLVTSSILSTATYLITIISTQQSRATALFQLTTKQTAQPRQLWSQRMQLGGSVVIWLLFENVDGAVTIKTYQPHIVFQSNDYRAQQQSYSGGRSELSVLGSAPFSTV